MGFYIHSPQYYQKVTEVQYSDKTNRINRYFRLRIQPTYEDAILDSGMNS